MSWGEVPTRRKAFPRTIAEHGRATENKKYVKPESSAVPSASSVPSTNSASSASSAPSASSVPIRPRNPESGLNQYVERVQTQHWDLKAISKQPMPFPIQWQAPYHDDCFYYHPRMRGQRPSADASEPGDRVTVYVIDSGLIPDHEVRS